MPRVKRGTIANKRRKTVLKAAKGFMWGRKTKYRLAKEAVMKAWSYSFRDRKAKKRTMRALHQTKISAACKANGTSYSKFIAGLKKNKVELDRKVLSQIAQKSPEVFSKIIETAKS